MALSITAAWDEARRFVAREAALLVPVGLTLMVVPGALAELLAPQPAKPDMASNGWLVSMAILGLFTLIGTLTVVRLALGGGVSVGEALGGALRRLPVALGANLLPAFAAVMAFLPIAQMLPAPGAAPQLGGAASLLLLIYMLGLSVGAFYLSARLLLLNVAVVAEPVGVIDALKRSFAMTRGHFPKLAGVMLLFVVAILIIGGAVSLAGGAVLIGVGKLLGVEPIGRLLLSLLTGGVNAVLSVYFAATLAMIYRQLVGPGPSGVFE